MGSSKSKFRKGQIQEFSGKEQELKNEYERRLSEYGSVQVFGASEEDQWDSSLLPNTQPPPNQFPSKSHTRSSSGFDNSNREWKRSKNHNNRRSNEHFGGSSMNQPSGHEFSSRRQSGRNHHPASSQSRSHHHDHRGPCRHCTPHSNGHSHGHSNGFSNGHSNGFSSGHSGGRSNGNFRGDRRRSRHRNSQHEAQHQHSDNRPSSNMHFSQSAQETNGHGNDIQTNFEDFNDGTDSEENFEYLQPLQNATNAPPSYNTQQGVVYTTAEMPQQIISPTTAPQYAYIRVRPEEDDSEDEQFVSPGLALLQQQPATSNMRRPWENQYKEETERRKVQFKNEVTLHFRKNKQHMG